MKFQDFLLGKEIDFSKAKIVRHKLDDDTVAGNLSLGYFEMYQSIQSKERFKNCEYLFSFIGTEGKEAEYVGCYKIKDCTQLDKAKLPADFLYKDFRTDRNYVFYATEKTDILSELEGRLVIEWKNPRTWHQYATKEMDMLYIRPQRSTYEFSSYDNVILTFQQLAHIIENRKEHSEWYNRLSSVAGVYLITDQSSGKHYIGSASSEDGGIWGRWNDYVRLKHGKNKMLRELIDQNPDHYGNFLFSILEVFPIKRDRRDVLRYEQLYKRKLCTIRFGLNDN